MKKKKRIGRIGGGDLDIKAVKFKMQWIIQNRNIVSEEIIHCVNLIVL